MTDLIVNLKSIIFYGKIKSSYFLERILNFNSKFKNLILFNYNKKIQNLFQFSIEDNKEYSEIGIEITPGDCGKFINLSQYIDDDDYKYFHIYMNDKKVELEKIKNNIKEIGTIKAYNNIKKNKIIIDDKIQSFSSLFEKCDAIIEINFKKFHRYNINNMRRMFFGYRYIKK